jgi:hypothetical protein
MLKGTSNGDGVSLVLHRPVPERFIEGAFDRRLDRRRLGGDVLGSREDGSGIERLEFGDARLETADSPTHLLGSEPGVSGSGRSGTGSHAKRIREHMIKDIIIYENPSDKGEGQNGLARLVFGNASSKNPSPWWGGIGTSAHRHGFDVNGEYVEPYHNFGSSLGSSLLQSPAARRGPLTLTSSAS